jgi:hypothetical protein
MPSAQSVEALHDDPCSAGWHVPAEQLFDKHSLGAVQAAPFAPAWGGGAQVASSVQELLRQSAGTEHGAPAAPGAHTPALQVAERQSPGAVHDEPAPLGAGGAGGVSLPPSFSTGGLQPISPESELFTLMTGRRM